MTTIFIPLFNKAKAQAVQSIDPSDVVPKGLALLAFLLTWRAQLSSILSPEIGQGNVPTKDSAKWIAKAISNTKEIRDFTSLLAVADSLQYSPGFSSSTTAKDLKEMATKGWQVLVEAKPKPGTKVLTPGTINEENLLSHRLGLRLQYVGTWQSESLYHPESIIKGSPIQTFDWGTFLTSFFVMMNNLGLKADLDKLNEGIWVKKLIEDTLFKEKVLFNDGLAIGSESNKCPLEQEFPISRAKPLPVPTISVPDDDKENPLVKLVEANLTSTKVKEVQTKKGDQTSSPPEKKRSGKKPTPPRGRKGLKFKGRRH